jgi:hypothetical protein
MMSLRDRVSSRAMEMRERYPSLRWGQALMNALYEIDPELYSMIGDDLNCFYDDSKSRQFLDNL